VLPAAPGPHFDCEELGSHNQFPMPSQAASRSSYGCAPAPARGRGGPGCPRWSYNRRRARNWKARLGSSRSPSRGFPEPSGRPALQFRPPSAAGRADVGRCRRTFTRSASDARPRSVSGVTMVATSARVRRPSNFAFSARRWRWSSLKRSRRSPNCSRRKRFSSRR
jgi:hypothetical protein